MGSLHVIRRSLEGEHVGEMAPGRFLAVASKTPVSMRMKALRDRPPGAAPLRPLHRDSTMLSPEIHNGQAGTRGSGMRIALNAVAVEGGGGETYLLNIVKGLCALRAPHELLVILSPRHRPILASLPASVRTIVCDDVPARAGLRMLWEQIVLPVRLRHWEVDLLFAAYNTGVLCCPAPVVLVAHNSNPYSRLPIPWSVYGRSRHVLLRLLGRLSARTAQRVVFVSHTSARIMAPRMGVAPSHVRVVHYGWSPPDEADLRENPQGLDLPERYVLTVADLQPHKNVETLLRAFDRLGAADGYPGHLVIAGGRKDMSSGYARRLFDILRSLPCRERVHFVGSIPHPSLDRAYQRAELFVFPSLEETFGLPLLEAMGAGVPAVVSDWRRAPGGEKDRFNVGPEVCGEAAEFFDPTSATALADAMARVLHDLARRTELAEMGIARARQFSWEHAAREMLAIFEEVMTAARENGRS